MGDVTVCCWHAEAVRKLREMVAAAPLPVDKAKLPFVATRVGFDNPGLRGADFFGVGLPEVKRILETLPCAAATSIVPLGTCTRHGGACVCACVCVCAHHCCAQIPTGRSTSSSTTHPPTSR